MYEKKSLLALLVLPLAFLSISIYAQTLVVYDVQTDEYPSVNAKFFAFDENGKQITDLSEEDFQVIEHGEEREVTYVTCPVPKPPQPISSVLTIDISGSMKGESLEIAKSAAKVWVNMLPLNSSECAVTSFNKLNYNNQDFTTNKTRLLEAIDELSAGGGTDFDAGLINLSSGALLVAESGKHRKIIVFLTVGHSSVSENEIVQKANDIDVLRVYNFCII